MIFLLGLFIGVSIFILGFFVGGFVVYNLPVWNEDNSDSSVGSVTDTSSLNGQTIPVLLDDFGVFLDAVIDCHQENVPFRMLIKTNNDDVFCLVVKDKTMHLDECFNIDNEG